MPDPIRVLLADDHPVVRGGLSALLETLDGIVVVAEAEDGEAAIRETALHRPDVVVMDLRMPGMDGMAATRRITAGFPGTSVLVLTMFDEDALIAAALSAGARGYLLKGADQAEIERAIRAVGSGDAIFSSGVAERVLRRVTPDAPVRALPQLTSRERDVTDLLAAGLSNAAIADQLSLATKTVGNHISAIFLKLGVATRAEAIVVARQAGLGQGRAPDGSL
ncbi:response regulator transcription factor [Citricoccus sp. NPDC079358]|uniref:response regulator transcription factor n=1 Tax=Citricoccus sp. NPDC079358 TaxID=3154653 RepID=UPI00344C5639